MEQLPETAPWTQLELLRHEKDALGFYLTSHPLAEHGETIRQFGTSTAAGLSGASPGKRVYMGGMITDLRLMDTKTSRNGLTRYARFQLQDFMGQTECVIWPDAYVTVKDRLAEDVVCFVQGTVERTREKPGLVVTALIDPESGQRALARGLAIQLCTTVHTPRILDKLAVLLSETPGDLPVYLMFLDEVGRKVLLRPGGAYTVSRKDVVIADLEELVGAGNVAWMGGPPLHAPMSAPVLAPHRESSARPATSPAAPGRLAG